MYTLIEHRKLNDNATSITFGSIPQNFTDLLVVFSLRLNGNDYFEVNFNGSSSSIDQRILRGSGSSAVSYVTNTSTSGGVTPSYHTASTFSNGQIYVPNYTNGSNKSFSVETVAENNSTAAFQTISSGVRSSTEAITSLSIVAPSLFMVYFLPNSSVTLYGINRTSAIGKPKAIGGSITYSNGYWLHTFTGSGTFSAQQALEVDGLVVAGGGGGGSAARGGGGGAGGFRTLPATTLSAGSYGVVVGAGGSGLLSSNGGTQGFDGSSSSFLSISSLGGGGGGAGSDSGPNPNGTAGRSGGSGGGGGVNGNSGQYSWGGGSGTAGQGNNGGSSGHDHTTYGKGGGGGGAGGVGASITANGQTGTGGIGLIWNGAYYAGGGGGAGDGSSGTGPGGLGGGGRAGFSGTPAGEAGTANTGGGGGAGWFNPNASSGAGGSGVVILRYRAD